MIGSVLEMKALPSNEEPDIFEEMCASSKKQRYDKIFDYHKSIAAELGDDRSFYTSNFSDILWKCQRWQEELPKVQMFYAVKANPDPVLLRLLVLLGVNFDCATQWEIQAVLSAGASPKRIVFAHPISTSRDIEYAKRVGVDLMTFDSEDKLHKVCKIYPSARLLIRFRPSEVECGFDFREKFGCKLDAAYHLLRIAKSLKLNVTGVSFHVGSLNTLATAYSLAIQDSRKIFDYAQSLGFRFSILDIGGGFYGSIGTDALFQKVTRYIRQSLSIHFPMDDVRVIAEPGCYVVCSAVTLTTSIIGQKMILDVADENMVHQKPCYFLNNSIYGSFLNTNDQYGIFHEPLLSQDDLQPRQSFISILFGQTLCSMDVIKRDTILPEMRIGESIVWKNIGAYNQIFNTKFCGFLLPDSKYVFQKDSRLKSDKIKNLSEISKYLSDFVHVIHEDYNNNEIEC